ncbi:cytochrome P450 [Auriscalpium vulgare]|uniref:Cytochrome P450 n=1 Tax=Auriscalpium vulgare TaxID=40419 RepID=A0ACB8S921_9AGAM|nr:cytochrome P450 [Auriscalpium vulgare]
MAATYTLRWLDCAALALALYVLRAWARARRRAGRLPLPPGPPPLPVLGNLLDIPREKPWLTYTAWGKQYGEVTSLTVPGRIIVFVNSARAAKDLFERTGTRYLDRPVIPMMEMMEAHFNLAITRYSDKWRVERRIIDQSLRPSAAVAYLGMQRTKAHAFLRQVLHHPENHMEYLKHFTGAVVMSLVYGYEVKEENDHFIGIAEKLLNLASESILPGALLVNDFPVLRHLPDWLPGMGFKDRARHGVQLSKEMVNAPFDRVKEEMEKGTARRSLVRDNLLEMEGDGEEGALRNAAASVYAAGAETTISTLSTFFLILLLYPDVQARAQAELDAVLGGARLPDYVDRAALPYVDAVCKELLRWRLVLPLGVAHATTENDVYNGYFIPKGATVLPNAWAILHDEAAYPEPDAFRPERYLAPNGSVRDDPLLPAAFGFGRRMCPGRHLVDTTLWVLVASVLAVYKVEKAKDADGKEIPVAPEYTDTLISHPAPFQCTITPRHERSVELILATVAERDQQD